MLMERCSCTAANLVVYHKPYLPNTGGDAAPAVSVSSILDLPEAIPELSQISTALPAIRKEIHRLESDSCAWRARSYFSAHLRNTEAGFYRRLPNRDRHARETPYSPPPYPLAGIALGNASPIGS